MHLQSENRRSGFIDAARSVAIVRVVLIHTYWSAGWLSFLVASMPTMFFCAGAVTAMSLQRSPPEKVVRNRLRRLLPPLWVLGLFAFAFMGLDAVRHPGVSEYALERTDVLGWVLPLWAPGGAEWQSQWWGVLWYLRTYVHLLLLSPLLVRALRRWPVASLATPALLLVVLQARANQGHADPWFLFDLATFSIFWLLGIAYHDGVFTRLGRRRRLEIAGVSALAAAAWIMYAGAETALPHGWVNSSAPTHVFVGLAWLFGFLAFEGAIERVATWSLAARVITFLNGRAVTLYLWHSAVIWLVYGGIGTVALGWIPGTALPSLSRAAGVGALCVVFTLALGWVEDIGARRRPRVWPTRPKASRAETARAPDSPAGALA